MMDSHCWIQVIYELGWLFSVQYEIQTNKDF